MSEKISEGAKQAIDVATPVVNAAKDTTQKIGTEVNSAISNGMAMLNNPSVLYGLIIVIVVAIICSIIMYYLIVESVFDKRSVTIDKTKRPVKGYVRSEYGITSMPANGNGKRRSYTFWIYLNDMNNMPGKYKHVWSIGDKDGTMENMSPLVFLDKDENKMYIKFSKSGQSVPNLSSLNSDLNIVEMSKYGIVVDYVPLQRWVHVAIVVTDGNNGGNVSVYLDGELAKTSTSGDKIGNTSIRKDLSNLDLEKSGFLTVGGDGVDGKNAGFNGLVSKVSVYNYDLNSRDIYNIYDDGPIDGVLASLGYGVRSPIYKLET